MDSDCGAADSPIAPSLEDDVVYTNPGGERCTLIDAEVVESPENRMHARILAPDAKGVASEGFNGNRTPPLTGGTCLGDGHLDKDIKGHHRILLSIGHSIDGVDNPSPDEEKGRPLVVHSWTRGTSACGAHGAGPINLHTAMAELNDDLTGSAIGGGLHSEGV